VLYPVPADRAADIEALLASGDAGLGQAEVAARRDRHGANAIVEEPPGRGRALLFEALRDPMIWLLAGAAVLYALTGARREAIVLGVAIVPLLYMDAWLHRRTRASTRGLRQRLASRACVRRDGVESTVAAVEIVPGDLVRVRPGDWFPADGLVVAGERLQAEESTLTGESVPAQKRAFTGRVDGAIEGAHWGFAGTRLLTGDALLRVVTTGAETLYGQIVRSAQTGPQARTPLQSAIGRLVLALGAAAVGLCALLAGARIMQGHGLADALLSAATLAMVALPEEFPVIFAFYLGVGVYRLARRQALVRRAAAVEDVGRLSCLCVDKTGTLTEGRLQLQHCVAAPSRDEAALLRIAALASRQESRDPIDLAILEKSRAAPAPDRVALFPFTEASRRETAVYHAPGEHPGRALLVACKGAPEAVLARCGLDEDDATAWRRRADELAAAHRVIACAMRTLDASAFTGAEPLSGFEFAGLLAFEDPIREGAAEAVKSARQAGLRVIMVTGDHPAYAMAIARELGIADAGGAPTIGADLERDPEAMKGVVAAGTQVVARALPAHKLALVEALQRAGEVVAVTGDGVNDVPALRAANVGIAMGRDATQSAREAAAIVLLDDNLRTIVNAIFEGRQLFRNLRMSFAYLLVVHLALVAAAALVPLAGYPLVFLPVHLVWLELIIHPTAMFAFQAHAGAGSADPPRRRARFFFAPSDWFNILAAGTLASAAATLGYVITFDAGGAAPARTIALVVVVASSVAVTAALSRLATPAARVLAAATLVTAIVLTAWAPVASLLDLAPVGVWSWVAAAVAGALAVSPALRISRASGRMPPRLPVS